MSTPRKEILYVLMGAVGVTLWIAYVLGSR